MEEALSRARERIEQASSNAIDPSQTRAAFERARAQMEALTQMGAELEAILPEEIGLAEHVSRKLLETTRGLVLVTGPTGSGKSTTIASLIEQLNQRGPARAG